MTSRPPAPIARSEALPSQEHPAAEARKQGGSVRPIIESKIKR